MCNYSNRDDIIVWPDDSWCYRHELEEFGTHKSDDYRVIKDDSAEWHDFVEEKEG